MDLSPIEQSFFDEGDATGGAPDAAGEPPPPRRSADGGGSHRRRSRRRSRLPFARQLRRKLGNTRWRKTFVATILAIAAVAAGYRASMFVIDRDLPTPAELGVEARGH
jgi:hypothetical protein